MSNADEIICKRVRDKRVKLGMSQKDLAEAISVSSHQIRKYESALNKISNSKLLLLSKVMNVPIDYFFKDLDGDPNNVLPNGTKEDLPSENEIITLVKAYNDIKSPALREKVIELIKSISQSP